MEICSNPIFTLKVGFSGNKEAFCVTFRFGSGVCVRLNRCGLCVASPVSVFLVNPLATAGDVKC